MKEDTKKGSTVLEGASSVRDAGSRTGVVDTYGASMETGLVSKETFAGKKGTEFYKNTPPKAPRN